ncbi:hypothetical protein [Zoogloea sp.]|uniref:hypothetical protein n=1 Tax=Zoogloea sp. TaxID=49181 RepID=UPI002D05D46E|nr:hypothetical protein [Zoogloea sp.]
MRITLHQPDGPREAVVPPEGIHDDAMLIKSLILTLAREAHAGVGVLTLSIDLAGTDPARLVAIGKRVAIGDPGAREGMH